MQNNEVTIQCPNDLCKVANPEGDKFCQRCGMPLVKRYLWALGEGVETCQVGELIAERYLLKSHQILLDTKPGLPPEAPYLDISNGIKPYLRLVTYRLQVPQVYGLVTIRQGGSAKEILLLEQAPIYTDAVPEEGQLMPELFSAWKEASSLRQLNWLWQIAQLWQPFSSEGVASSLLLPHLLRVEGSLVRLLQLQLDDPNNQPTLLQLGQLWSHLAAAAQQSIAGFVTQLSQDLQQGEIQSAEQLIACLDRALTEAGRSCKGDAARPARSFKIGTCTDTGPSRQRNEDACYPASGTTIVKPPEPKAIAIVCDGIGGHEGGNVASNLAIETLQQQVYQLPLDGTNLDPITLSAALERFTCTANDRISQRNDKEHRQGRQRMGTTLVMAVGHQHEVYVAHVGDSRAYWITRTGCHQITLDDDVAAREVRLGYAVYRDALQQPSAGSLVQAIGMSASVHPTVQRFVLDEDSVFLLCSDGLSDYDLVEQCWQAEILPILEGKVDVATASQRLVEIGNTRNGHDNITVALVHCQVNSCEPEAPLSYSLAEQANFSGTTGLPPAATMQTTRNLDEPRDLAAFASDTQLLPSSRNPRRGFVPLLVGICLILSLGGGLLAYLAYKGQLSRWVTVNLDALNTRSPDLASPTISTGVQPRSFYVTNSKLILNREKPAEELAIASPAPQQASQIKNILPPGSVVEVLKQETISQQGTWLNLRVEEVCSNSSADRTSTSKPGGAPIKPTRTTQTQPSTTASKSSPVPTGERLMKEGEDGWIEATNVEHHLQLWTTDALTQRGKCSDLTPSGDASVVESPTLGLPESAKVQEKTNQNITEQKTR